MNQEIVNVCFEYFRHYVEMHSEKAFTGFKGNKFLEHEEGYKSKAFDDAQACLELSSWNKELIGEGRIAKCFKKAYKEKHNLVYYQDGNKIERIINENKKEAEEVLYDIYLGDDDKKAFERATKLFGERYALIAYMFFIKDKDKYLPIAPRHFEEAFAVLGENIQLQYNCSWDNYVNYLSAIKEIKEKFEEYFKLEISLLDAHSFVWMIKEAKNYYISKESLPDLCVIERKAKDKDIIANEYAADCKSAREIATDEFIAQSEFKEYVGHPREKPELIDANNVKRYKRDKQRALNALNRAGYLCEYGCDHRLFLRKNANKYYTESHHLVPMAFQELFPLATLDTESNIVSLCSSCHNQIHYGQGADEIITKLYNQRKEALKREGIDVTLEQLLAMYK